MSVRLRVWEVGRRALAMGVVVCCALLLVAGTASADATFGGNPNQAVTPELTCENAATIVVPYWRAPTCTWWWSHPGVGTDIVPLPVTGGSGTVTGVTLPAMPNPGTMQVVILTAALSATYEPSKPQFICCQIKELGPTFTVPANQVTTVPQSLAVSATREANLSAPGETSFGDIAALSVLTPGASLPLRFTGLTSLNSPAGFDVDEAYFPAPTATSGEFNPSVDPGGFELLAQFQLAEAGAPETPAPTPAAPTPGPAARGGLRLAGKAFRPAGNGRSVTLGKATNPPTATTIQTLTAPGAAASRAGHRPLVLGKGKTTVPSGRTVPLKLALNARGRAKLRKRKRLKATLTIVATNSQGESQTVTRTVTLRPAKKPRKKRQSPL